MTYPTKQALTALNRALHLPATGREQDWDIELAGRTGQVSLFPTSKLTRLTKMRNLP